MEPISTSSTAAASNANSAAISAASAAAAAAAAATAAANARRGRKPDHDDISQEQVLRIYQEELAKMMSGASPNFNPVFNPALSGLSALSGARAMASNIRDYNRYFSINRPSPFFFHAPATAATHQTNRQTKQHFRGFRGGRK